MGTEAQKLISLSLEKIANCRRRRREMSLHKNLLVTTVIHKARLAIMEETYYMMSTYGTSVDHHQGIPRAPTPSYHQQQTHHLQQQQPTLEQQAAYPYGDECEGPPAPPQPDYVMSECDGVPPMTPAPHHYDMDRDGEHQLPVVVLPEVAATVVMPVVTSQHQHLHQPIITGPVLSAALASTQQSPLTTLTDCCSSGNGPMDWEGEQDMAIVLRCSSELSGGGDMLCVRRLEQVDCAEEDETDEDDKENLSPVEYSLSCLGSSGSETSTSCLLSKFVGRTVDASSGSAFASSRGGAMAGHKRLRDADDDLLDSSKRCKWDSTSCSDGADDSDDTSHALRLVSVLSASLGGGISSPVVSASSCTTTTTTTGCAGRLVRSNSTDLCGKQAMDTTMELVGRSPVLAIAV